MSTYNHVLMRAIALKKRRLPNALFKFVDRFNHGLKPGRIVLAGVCLTLAIAHWLRSVRTRKSPKILMAFLLASGRA